MDLLLEINFSVACWVIPQILYV